MVSLLNNVFTIRNAHMCLQCAAYQARGGSNFPREMKRAFCTHKPTAKSQASASFAEFQVRGGQFLFPRVYISSYQIADICFILSCDT
jgi:hypothetical protein